MLLRYDSVPKFTRVGTSSILYCANKAAGTLLLESTTIRVRTLSNTIEDGAIDSSSGGCSIHARSLPEFGLASPSNFSRIGQRKVEFFLCMIGLRGNQCHVTTTLPGVRSFV